MASARGEGVGEVSAWAPTKPAETSDGAAEMSVSTVVAAPTLTRYQVAMWQSAQMGGVGKGCDHHGHHDHRYHHERAKRSR